MTPAELDAIEARAKRVRRESESWVVDEICETQLALVAEVRRLQAVLESGREISISCDRGGRLDEVAMNGFVGYLAADDPKALPYGQASARFVVIPLPNPTL